jgi:excisionase family DNA binding protein
MTDSSTVVPLRDDPDRLFTYVAVAEWADVPERTVRKWVSDGTGPRVIKLGRHVRIRAADLLTWLEGRYVA